MAHRMNTQRIVRLTTTTPSFRPHARRLASVPTNLISAHRRLAFTNKMQFFNSITSDGDATPSSQIPTFSILDREGKVRDGAHVPDMVKKFAQKLYEQMVLLPTLDDLLINVQRHGKISIYATSFGEEASVIGSAAALAPDDEVLAQYREVGVLLWRDFGLDNVMNQLLGNVDDPGQGKQLPTHYGSVTHHFHTISSPLATQIPQAAGVAFALRRTPERRNKSIAVCYFGEGAASEGDFHAGLLFASAIPAPALYIARNNGFAISTPTSEQYAGDGIGSRGPGYGIDTIRVDGNDVLAMLAATRAARKLCLEGRPVLLEAMTYRIGHHSASDDSSAYRSPEEVERHKYENDPISRYRLYLESRRWWDGEEEEALRSRLRDEVRIAFQKAEKLPKFELQAMFSDVYAGEEPWNLKEQRQEFNKLLQKYGGSDGPWVKELEKFRNHGHESMQDELDRRQSRVYSD